MNQPAVASTDAILNGNGAQAGLKQLISERQQADLGVGNLGRLSLATATSTMTVSQDGSPFGFQLGSVNSSLTGATVTGPTGSPPSVSVDFGATPPNAGDTIQFDLTLPDGSSQTITLTATNASPPGANQFTIGATAGATATNLQTALTGALSNLAQTALPAASAIAAANDFFNSDPPQIVAGPPPYDASMSLVSGTPANTVFWYTGENGGTPALQTALAQVGPSTTVAYGMRANEPAFANLLANIGGARGDHVFGKRSERPGELRCAEPEGHNQPHPAIGHAIGRRYRGRPRQCANHREERQQPEHADADHADRHAAGHGRHQSGSDRRADLGFAEQPVGVDVGDGAARAVEPGEFSRAGDRVS